MDFSGLNQVNEALTSLGNTGMAIGADWKRVEEERNRALQLLDFHAVATDQAQKTTKGILSRPYEDMANPAGDFNDQLFADLKTSYQDKIRAARDTNPTLAIEMQKVADGLTLGAQEKALTHFDAAKKSHFLGTYMVTKKQSLDLLSEEADPVRRAGEVDKFEAILKTLTSTGVMDAKTATHEFLDYKHQVDVNMALRMIRGLNLGSVETAETIGAKIGDPNIFPNLNEDDRTKLLYQLNVQDEKYRAQKADQKLSQINAKLYTAFAGDYTKAINYLMIPENQQAQGLTLHEANTLLHSMAAQRKELDEQKTKATNEEYNKEVQAVFQYMVDGKYGAAMNLVRKSTVIDPKDKFQFITTITRKEEPKTDPVSFVRLEDAIYRGDAQIGDIVSNPNITKADKNSLVTKFYSQAGQTQREAEKQSKDFLKSQIISTGMLGNPIPAEWERVYQGYALIDQYADAAKRGGKPWGVKEYMDYSKQLADFYRTTPQTKLQDMQKMISPVKTAPVAGGTGKSVVRQPGESIDAYEKRMGIK
jgi:hypothetical protein